VGPSGKLDRLDPVRVGGDRAVMRPIQTHDLGQQVRISGVGLRAEVECRERYCPTENGLIANTS
jgi:hypothetical protein